VSQGDRAVQSNVSVGLIYTRSVARVPTIYGEQIEHSDRALRDAEQRMRSHIDHLKLGYRKAQHAIVEIGDLWSGADGTKAMRGPRVPPTLEAVRRVASMIHDERQEVRALVMKTLGFAGEHSAKILDEVLIALDDAVELVRLQSARLLEQLGPSLPKQVVPQLRGRLGDPTFSVRWTMVMVLVGKVSTDELVSVLLASTPDSDARGHVIHGWLRAANAIDPMPARLAERVRELEALFGRKTPVPSG
jgi:hypothetical protein